MKELSECDCEVCQVGAPTVTEEEIAELLPMVPNWLVVEKQSELRLERKFKFRDFAEALAFTDKVGALAEAHAHHPTMVTAWGSVKVTWWTHKIHGLHRNDFIMASKTDLLNTD